MEGKKGIKPDLTVNAVGLICPAPILRTKQALSALLPGQVLLVRATDPTTRNDIPSMARRMGHEVIEADQIGEVLTFLIRKGGPARPA